MQTDITKIWNPRIDHDPAERNNILKINVSSFIYSFVATIMDAKADDGSDTDTREESLTELDYHANMPVVGRHTHVILDTVRIAEANPFTPGYEAMQIPIIDAAVKYYFPTMDRAT